MKFIRDIISEKRSVRPAVMPLPAPTSNDDQVEEPAMADLLLDTSDAMPRTLGLADLQIENEGPDGIAVEGDADSRTGQFAENGPNIFANDDGPSDEVARAQPSAPMAPEPVAETTIHPTELPANDRSLSEMPFVSVLHLDRPVDIAPEAEIQVPPPAAGRGANRSGRVKTRLLGFSPESQGLSSPFEKDKSRANDTFPVGWLVVVAGPGRGASFPLHDGVARIGRGEDQTVCLNFGDNSISRENHVSVAFDSEQDAFFIGQSGRSNIVRLNNKPLLSTEQVRTGDQIRVGETTLRLVALCGEGFSWATNH